MPLTSSIDASSPAPQAVAIIPARMASVRFPGKILASETGKPLIQHVWESARRAQSLSRIVIATDDDRVREAADAFEAECILTSPDHDSGTSRLAEAAATLSLTGDTIVVNIQGDEPEMQPAWIDAAVEALRNSRAPVSTVAIPFGPGEDADDPAVVKVVLKRGGAALYFSRAAIPFARDPDSRHMPFLKHLGLYAYRRPFLDTYITLEPTPIERTEMLEQLRVLFYGYDISVAVGTGRSWGGIDTREQYDAFVRRQLAQVNA